MEAAEREPIGERERKLIETQYKGHRMGVPALIMLYCGLRKGEILALTWEDLDLDAKTLTVNKSAWFDNNRVAMNPPKSRASNRTISIPDKLASILQAAQEMAQSELVCPRQDGGLMTHKVYLRNWNSFIRYFNLKAGGRDRSRSKPKMWAMEVFTGHQLRHTYATMLYDADVDVLTAQKLLGHADVQTTIKIYTHLSAKKQQASIEGGNNHVSQL